MRFLYTRLFCSNLDPHAASFLLMPISGSLCISAAPVSAPELALAARPDRRLLLMLFGVSAGGCGDTSKPGTLGALLGDLRSAEEADPKASSELDSLDIWILGLGGEDLRRDIFRFFCLLTFFFFFSSLGTAFFGSHFDSETGLLFFVPFGSVFTGQDDTFRRKLDLLTFRFFFLKDTFLKIPDDT